uniref:Uncharacterized protein n=1 Tax=Cucumis melo TaxID=3656 RepID=A0A9I9E2B8_CUCME
MMGSAIEQEEVGVEKRSVSIRKSVSTRGKSV